MFLVRRAAWEACDAAERRHDAEIGLKGTLPFSDFVKGPTDRSRVERVRTLPWITTIPLGRLIVYWLTIKWTQIRPSEQNVNNQRRQRMRKSDAVRTPELLLKNIKFNVFGDRGTKT